MNTPSEGYLTDRGRSNIMHIKRIIIQGFKTYKNTTVIDLVSPQHNVVVGRNGSGKSNFFAAIRFVLSDAYTHMTREERQGLIHEGSGTVMSAYVEIAFDNTDRRFPIAKDEVSIRRTIGLKKDDYSLDNKSATRSDVMNLLESAGFSRSNPYYIVPQGRITALTNSKDSERLALLKEVSGAKVFETKLKESMKEMNNSNYKKQRIDETLHSVDERISDLQIESKDLKEFQGLEKSKKIFEFNLFDRELNDLNTQVESIDETYSNLLSESQQDLEELDKREKICQQLTDSISQLKISLKVTGLDKDQTDSDYNHLLKVIADKKVKLDELHSTINIQKEEQTNYHDSIQHYQNLIKHHEDKISHFTPNLQKYQKKESKIKSKLSNLITKQRALYSKQNRFLKFTSKEERDRWLKEQISETSKELEIKDNIMNKLDSQANSEREEIFEYNKRIEEINESLSDDKQGQIIEELQESMNDLKIKITELTDQRKSFWRDEIRLKSIQDSLNHDLDNANYLVNQTMDRGQSQGLSSVNSIVKKLHLEDSVYGPLADLFSVSDKYKTAVEVIAGNALFHVVVDNDKTASLIMDELNRSKAGRVTFMPLNRLSPINIEYPDGSEHQCIPLIKKLKFNDEKVGRAIRQVFAKTIVCNDLQKGSELARAFKVNAITLDGDRAETKGVLSGGYRDYKNSRLDALKTQAKKRNEIYKTEQDLKKCVQDIENVNRELTSYNNELQYKARELDAKLSTKEPLKTELAQLQNKKYNADQELNSLITNIEAVRTIRGNLSTILNQHHEELKSDFTQSLSTDETNELQNLSVQISECENKLDRTVTKLSDIEAKISKFGSELTDNYKPHLLKLIKDREAPNSRLNENQIHELEKELEYLTIQLDTAESKNQSATDEFNNVSDEIAKSDSLLKKANDQQILIMKKLEKFSKTTEKNLSKKAILVARRDEIQRKILELGVLPEEAFQQSIYDKFNSDQLLKKLTNVNDNLSKYSHINKKAMEQYHTFTKQRDELMERRKELEKSRESIENLITSLETQKDEAITQSFKQVAKSFHEIFEKLVPAGVGNLIMQKKDQNLSRNDEEDEDEIMRSSDEHTINEAQNIDNYVGVSISASFNSKNDEQQRIEQFSGGQKSLCAIALILAIQKCDPAPFYLFDEIDANLDTQYRTAVAAMINSLSNKAQFICTTFRPEMLQVADKFYGVMFSNKVSTVSEINREEAMSFVEGQQQH